MRAKSATKENSSHRDGRGAGDGARARVSPPRLGCRRAVERPSVVRSLTAVVVVCPPPRDARGGATSSLADDGAASAPDDDATSASYKP